jgi:citrate lyase synthetase
LTENTSVVTVTYNTIMNIVTHSPEWGRYFIQQQNIRKKIAKTLDISAEIRDSEESSTIPPDEIDVTVS